MVTVTVTKSSCIEGTIINSPMQQKVPRFSFLTYKLKLHDAISLTNFFVFTLAHYVNFKAMRYESTNFKFQ